MTDESKCQHRSLQLAKEQNDVMTVYVCGRCASRFQVEVLVDPPPASKEPMFPKNRIPWGQRARQA